MVKTTREPGDENNPDTSSFGVSEPTVYPARPDFATGFGLVDAEAACLKIVETTHCRQDTIQTSGSSQSWCIEVPAGSPELKVVLAWDDPPGCTLGHPAVGRLVNDLDLVLADPNGQTYRPWVLKPFPLGPSPGDGNPDPISRSLTEIQADPGEDHTNNVEMISVSAPMQGTWKATVKGYKLASGTTQSYSLVSSYPASAFCSTEAAMMETDVCKLFPKLCHPKLCFLRLDSRRGYFRIPTLCAIPIRDICAYVINCPGCEHRLPWQL